MNISMDIFVGISSISINWVYIVTIMDAYMVTSMDVSLAVIGTLWTFSMVVIMDVSLVIN